MELFMTALFRTLGVLPDNKGIEIVSDKSISIHEIDINNV